MNIKCTEIDKISSSFLSSAEVSLWNNANPYLLLTMFPCPSILLWSYFCKWGWNCWPQASISWNCIWKNSLCLKTRARLRDGPAGFPETFWLIGITDGNMIGQSSKRIEASLVVSAQHLQSCFERHSKNLQWDSLLPLLAISISYKQFIGNSL